MKAVFFFQICMKYPIWSTILFSILPFWFLHFIALIWNIYTANIYVLITTDILNIVKILTKYNLTKNKTSCHIQLCQMNVMVPNVIPLLSKPYVNEVTLTGQNPPSKCCYPLKLLTQFKRNLDLLILKIWGL